MLRPVAVALALLAASCLAVAAQDKPLYDLTATLVASATHHKKGTSFAMSSKSPDRFLPELVQTTVNKVLWPQKPAK